MRVTARHEAALPQGEVFAALLDFPAFEGMARRNGIDVRRRDGIAAGEMTAWLVRAPFRGEIRDVDLRYLGSEPESRVNLAVASGGIEASVAIWLAALARDSTHIEITVDLRASSFAARVLLQSLRPVRGMIVRRMTARLSGIVRQVEKRQARRHGQG